MARVGLEGLRVLVTRPAERAERLAAGIEREGGIAVRFPVIAIEPCPAGAPAPGEALQYDVVVFVSPAAVTHGLRGLGLGPGAHPAIAAVGPATARALGEAGLTVHVEPVGGHDSEGLLAAPGLAAERISGRRVLIVRGEGGREALAEGLMARGASVDYAEVYRRVRPAGLDPTAAADSDIVTATSTEGLANLLALLDPASRTALLQRPLAVNSERIAAAAAAQGFRLPPRVADAPGDAGLLEAVRRCAADLRDGPSERP
jgi:uroporphyrinogen-III synthase